jgi:alpha-pyrone synthase
MAVPDFTPEQALPNDPLFFPKVEGMEDHYKIPVQQRLDKFREKAVPLVAAVCRKAVADAGISMDDIGKLVVVSSTGFIGPGLDCHIIQEIGKIVALFFSPFFSQSSMLMRKKVSLFFFLFFLSHLFLF